MTERVVPRRGAPPATHETQRLESFGFILEPAGRRACRRIAHSWAPGQSLGRSLGDRLAPVRGQTRMPGRPHGTSRGTLPRDFRPVAARASLSRTLRSFLTSAVALVALAGCSPTVKVQAPDKPIEINVNIRIEHEVRVKIDRELDAVFSQNPELFGLPEEKKP